ncbi:efflux RND transporter periplasmic adaptor subunit [uncultured Pseudodesulfovibrio sp.]|uniref:efflux RND transporter periplasmic adaptor subunit n=1 Tax=uncultured Pseudodesulfovibrio sp. TaxID=2035858 RepID=UPI0029C876EF|nr:efflux RND transporter periplasmic adaptor subunit [uncultured Pseudodesulfovibrio sp.]
MKTRAIIIFLFVASLFALPGCSSEPAAVANRASSYFPASTVQVQKKPLPRFFDAVGTVQAQTEIRVEAQVTGRVLKILVRPGDKVKAGDPMLTLDSRASQARLDRSKQASQSAASMAGQARDALAAAKAAFTKAESTYQRMKTLYDQKVVTAEEVEKAESAFLQAQAGLGQAKGGLAAAQARGREAAKVVQEAEIGLGYTTITAQADGEVAKRLVDPGDLAFPGKELLTLQTGGTLRLEAMVRESLITRVHLGDTLGVTVSALEGSEPLSAVVDEIEPLADPVTRSFLVKARLPEVPGLYPGMFGRLMVPLGDREAVLIPESVVVRVGQLETVMVKSGNTWGSVFIRTGARIGDNVEVLSGLSGGETLGLGNRQEAAQ